jgi:uncharacterized protein YxeA
MKKVLYCIIVILLAVVIFFCGVLVTINTQNSIIKQTEEVTKQATETSSSNGYITTQEHLSEMNNNKLQSLSGNFTLIAAGGLFELNCDKKYSKLSIKVSSYSYASSTTWGSESYLCVFGDGKSLIQIRDYTEHSIDISNYKVVKIQLVYVSGNGYYEMASGKYTAVE